MENRAKKLSLLVPQTNLNMVTQLCMMLESILDPLPEPLTESSIMEAVFIECVYWSIGGTLTEESQPQFNELVKRLCGLPSKSDSEKDLCKVGSTIASLSSPNTSTILIDA